MGGTRPRHVAQGSARSDREVYEAAAGVVGEIRGFNAR
jgi:hypothetical protein